MNLKAERKSFHRPSPTHRPFCDWVWNDELNTEVLLEQLDAMADGGVGGVTIRPGHGLDPEEYLSESWIEAMNAVARRAKKRGVDLWIVHDFDFPPPRAVRQICTDHPEFCRMNLAMDDIVLDESHTGFTLSPASGTFGPQTGIVGMFIVTADHESLAGGAQEAQSRAGNLKRIRYAPVLFDLEPAEWKGARVLVFRIVRVHNRLNNLDTSATRAFTEAVCEPYYHSLRRQFSTAVGAIVARGCGLDPQHAHLPWDPELNTLFQETRGYSILEKLPELFFDVEGCEAPRFDFWSLVGDMFREGFTVPMQVWCMDHKVAYTSQMSRAHTVSEGVRNFGSAMALHEFQNQPLTLNRGRAHGLWEDAAAMKQVVSVERQFGKGGAVGVGFALASPGPLIDDLRADALYQFALGAENVHYANCLYSLRGSRKDEERGGVTWRQPYWPFLRSGFDVLSRAAWISSRGESRCDVLVLHPTASVQAAYRHSTQAPDGTEYTTRLAPFELMEKQFTALCMALLEAQIDFDCGEDMILAAHGRVDKRRFIVGKCTYQIVVIPPSLNIRKPTLWVLQDFAMGGGLVIQVGSAARLVEGRETNEVSRFIAEYGTRIIDGIDHFDYRGVVKALVDEQATVAEVRDADGHSLPSLRAQRRRWDESEILFIANASSVACTASVRFSTELTGRVERWDLDTGESEVLAACSPEEPIELQLSWHPGEAHALVVIQEEAPQLNEQPEYIEISRTRIEWHGKRLQPNLVPLYPNGIIEAEEIRTVTSVEEVRVVLSKKIASSDEPVQLVTRWHVEVSEILPVTSECQLAIELPQEAEISMNGIAVSLESADRSLDRAGSLIPLPPFELGTNIIEISGVYPSAENLETPWVCGDFWVEREENGGLTLELDSGILEGYSWDALGMPFYAGRIVYRAEVPGHVLEEGSRVSLELKGLRGAANVRVNDTPAEHVLWPPYSCDLTDSWSKEMMVIEIEVANSYRRFLSAELDAHIGDALDDHRRFGLIESPEIVLRKPNL